MEDSMSMVAEKFAVDTDGLREVFRTYKKFTVTFTLTCILLVFHYGGKVVRRRERLLAQFPQAERIPLLGYLPFLLRPAEKIVPLIASAGPNVGRTFVAWLGLTPYLMVMEGGEVAHAILSSPKYTEKGEILENVKAFLGTGLVTSESAIWKQDRKALNPFFKIQNFPRFIHFFNRYSKLLVSKIDSRLETDSMSTKPFNFQPLVCKATLDFVCEAVFGKELSFLDGKNADYLKALHVGAEITREKTFKPWIKWPFVWRLMGYKKQEEFCLQFMNGYILEEVRKRRELVNSTEYQENMKESDFPPLYQLLFDTRADEDIVYHVASVTVAGCETSATTLNYILFLLALNPECQKKAQEEIDQVFDDLGEDENLDMSSLNELKYLEMCVKETLRLYPAAPFVGRRSHVDIPLEDGKIIPKGVDIIFLLPEIHRDIRVFPDPETFDPERFLPEKCVTRNAVQYMPFSAGPRNCIGMRYAMLQIKSCLSHLLRHYTISTELKESDVGTLYGPLISPARPILVTLTRRRPLNNNK